MFFFDFADLLRMEVTALLAVTLYDCNKIIKV